MKKQFNKLASLLMATSLLTGCSLPADVSQEAQEYINDQLAEEAPDESSSDSSDQIIVLRDLFEPILEESGASASSSTIEKESDASSEASSEEQEETDKINIVFFGDSQFANGRSDGTDLASLLSKRVPNSVSYNLGIGGTTAALEQNTSEYDDYENWSSTCFIGMVYALEGKVDRNELLANYPTVLENMNRINTDEVDYYVIEYGANDFFNKTPLDMTRTDKNYNYSYHGSLCYGIDELKKLSPNAKFIVMTPFYSVYKDADGNIIGDSYVVSNGIATLADYAKKATNVAEDEKVFDFDGMFMAHSDLYLDTIEKYTIDGLHLSLTGRQIFSRLLAHVINWSEGYEPYAYLETDKIKIDEFNPDEYYRYRDDMLKEYYPENYERMMNGEYLLAQPQSED